MGQAVENLDATIDRPIVGGVTEAKVRVRLAEDIARNDEELIADRLGHELGGGAPRRFREHVKRTARLLQFETVLEALIKPVALAVIIRDDAGHVVIPGRDTSVLHNARRADKAELLQLDHL